VEKSNFQDQEGDGKDIIKPSLRDLAFDNESPSQDWIQWALQICVTGSLMWRNVTPCHWVSSFRRFE
jgi:hypothetical protein